MQGQDELGELAQGVEDMRRAMVSRETEKRQMEEATNRLMTSVSHDLRTPLTALLGYLEILEGDPRPASESPYLGKCRQRALQIRGMLNDLFEYFFVSTSDKTQADFPPCTVEQAFGKLLAEFADLLRQDDFAVNTPPLPSGTVRVNTGLLQRLFDNLLSNLRRYADRTQPVKSHCLRGIKSWHSSSATPRARMPNPARVLACRTAPRCSAYTAAGLSTACPMGCLPQQRIFRWSNSACRLRWFPSESSIVMGVCCNLFRALFNF